MSSSAGNPPRHAGAPQQFVADIAVDDLVDFGELRQTLFDVGVDAGDQPRASGFAEIGGDVRVGAAPTRTRRIGRIHEHSVGPDTEASSSRPRLKPVGTSRESMRNRAGAIHRRSPLTEYPLVGSGTALPPAAKHAPLRYHA
jgi:hypothetical protein